MLDSVIVARDRFLRPGGLVAPGQCSIILSAVQDEQVYNDTVSYWNDVYGDLTALRMNLLVKDWLTSALLYGNRL